MIKTGQYTMVFLAQIPELNLLLCIFHLEKGDRKKLLQLNPQKGAVKRI